MARFLIGRLLQGAAIVFLVATLTFLLLHLVPGDLVDAMAAQSRLPPEVADEIRRKFGLDRPGPVQFWYYITNVFSGDLGYSYSDGRPVWDAIRSRMPPTLLLAATALLVDFLVGITVGAWQGARAKSLTDDVLTIATLTLYSIPVFWFAIVLRYVFALRLGWLPVGGWRTAWVSAPTLPGAAWDHAAHLLLPAVTLGLIGAASTARFQRAAMLEAIGQDFVRTARAKGLEDKIVVLRHALRNALLPIVTLLGLSLPVLLSGAVLVETVFEWPGMGKLAYNAFGDRDYPLVTGIAIVTAVMVVLGSLAADALYRVVDPRTRGES